MTRHGGEPVALPEPTPSTQRAYATDWRHFQTWAEAHGVLSLPAHPGSVARYLEELSATARPATLRRRLASIARAHRAAGLPSPTEDAAARAVWARLREAGRAAPQAAEPLTVPALREVVARLPPGRAGSRDRVVLLLGFAGALRRSELVGLDVEDLTAVPEGLVLRLPGRTVGVARGVGPTCPVRAVEAWRREASVDAGPLLRPVERTGRVGPGRLGASTVNRIVKAAVAGVGLDPAAYSAHSLRSGLVASARVAGVAEGAIAAQTGHRRLPGRPLAPAAGGPFAVRAGGDLGL